MSGSAASFPPLRPVAAAAASAPAVGGCSFDIGFRTAAVAVRPEGVETRFREDGSVAAASVHWGDPDHIAASWLAGYGGDQYRMLVEHEIGHSFIADELGWPHSWSLWSAVHGSGEQRPMEEWSGRVRDEEHLVVSLQRFVNTGCKDREGRLEAVFGPRLPHVARQFVAVARPWLGLDVPPLKQSAAAPYR